MPIEINSQQYYRMQEVCRQADISRATLLRWMDRGIIPEPSRDRRGWRVFSEDELKRVISESGKIT